MRDRLQNLRNQALGEIINATSPVELEEIRIKYLGKKGLLGQLTQDLGKLDNAQKSEIGQLVNEIKLAITEALKNSPHQKSEIRNLKFEFDPTLPGILPPIGHCWYEG